MNASLADWLARNDEELTHTLSGELSEHIAQLRASGGFYAYAVLSLAGDAYKLQHVDAAFNREAEVKQELISTCGQTYARLSPNEWAHYSVDAFPKTTQLVADRNATFASVHTRKDPESFMLDEFEIAHIKILHRAMLMAMKRARDQGLFEGQNPFQILWAPDSPDDIMFCSAKALNPSDTFAAFWKEFGEDFIELECDCFD